MQAQPIRESDSGERRRAEAARYALLRRLAFAMRHHMVVHLQPIGMITEVMERRLQSASPDLTQIHQSMSKVNGHARAAVQSCLDVVSWLAPEEGVLAQAGEGIRECLALLRGNFNFRGFALRDEVGEPDIEVSRGAMRNVLPGCLLALTDRAASPADVVVGARTEDGKLIVTVELRPQEGPPGYAGEQPYRLLEWADVEALAHAEGVGFERVGDVLQLSFL